MENWLKKGDLKGDFSDPWEIPYVVKGLIPMTPGAWQRWYCTGLYSESFVRNLRLELSPKKEADWGWLLVQRTPGTVPLFRWFKNFYYLFFLLFFAVLGTQPRVSCTCNASTLQLSYPHSSQKNFSSIPLIGGLWNSIHTLLHRGHYLKGERNMRSHLWNNTLS
jgi:hypothetical protein